MRKPSDNAHLSQHFHGYEDLLRRIDDLCEQAERYQKARITPFLRPNELEAVFRYLGKTVLYHADGGYPEAEMKRIVIGDDTTEAEIVCLVADVSSKQLKVEHRDVLGALMNLGLRREQFGDLWVKEHQAVLYVSAENASYVIENLRQIHRLPVLFQVAVTIPENTSTVREYRKSVASYRLDAIVSCFCNLSRTRAQELIQAKAVSLNHEILEESAHLCHNGDTVSIRKYGRFILYETLGHSKKDRMVIRFGKYE